MAATQMKIKVVKAADKWKRWRLKSVMMGYEWEICYSGIIKIEKLTEP